MAVPDTTLARAWRARVCDQMERPNPSFCIAPRRPVSNRTVTAALHSGSAPRCRWRALHPAHTRPRSCAGPAASGMAPGAARSSSAAACRRCDFPHCSTMHGCNASCRAAQSQHAAACVQMCGTEDIHRSGLALTSCGRAPTGAARPLWHQRHTAGGSMAQRGPAALPARRRACWKLHLRYSLMERHAAYSSAASRNCERQMPSARCIQHRSQRPTWLCWNESAAPRMKGN